MSQVGNTFIQDSDPGAVGFGLMWMKPSTGDIYARNTSNTSWVYQGNANQNMGGALPITGGAMSGAITGATGWAPSANPNFSGSASLDSVSLVDQNDLTNAINSLTTTLNGNIKSAISSITGNFNVGSSIAVGYGTGLAHGGTIPLPWYGGVAPRQATISELAGVLVSTCSLAQWSSGVNDVIYVENCSVNTSTLVVTCTYQKQGYPSDPNNTTGTVNYIIVCIKAGS